MKKWYKSLSKEQIQRYVFLGLLILVFAAFFISLSIASSNEKNKPTKDPIEQPNTDNSENNNQNIFPMLILDSPSIRKNRNI